MSSVIIIFVSIVVGAMLSAFSMWLFIMKMKKNEPEKDQSFLLMQQQLNHLTETLDNKMRDVQQQLRESDKDMQGKVLDMQKDVQGNMRDQFSSSQKLIQEINKQMNEQLVGVTRGVTRVEESSRQFLTVADQLKDLEKVLKHQKQRGNWGEASLKLALENFLPQDAFEMQHYFPDGEAVDAIIKTKEGIIPVDAKFSLDNYQRFVNTEDPVAKALLEQEFKKDLKKRIDETSKYIRPKDGTLPFAIMYIPAEGIYYDLLINDIGTTNSRKLIDYAYLEKKVVITSPTTFLAYLQTILYGFRAFKFEESIKHVQKNVEQLSHHLSAYEESFKNVGKSLGAVVNHYDKAQTQYRLIDKDVLKITDSSNGFEKLELDKPHLEE